MTRKVAKPAARTSYGPRQVPRGYLSTTQAREYAGLTRSTFAILYSGPNPRIRSITFNNSRYFRQAWLDEFLNGLAEESA